MDYDEKKLPKDIRGMVKSTYYDFTIIGVSEIHVENKVVYLVYIKDETSCKTLRISDDDMEVISNYASAK